MKFDFKHHAIIFMEMLSSFWAYKSRIFPHFTHSLTLLEQLYVKFLLWAPYRVLYITICVKISRINIANIINLLITTFNIVNFVVSSINHHEIKLHDAISNLIKNAVNDDIEIEYQTWFW